MMLCCKIMVHVISDVSNIIKLIESENILFEIEWQHCFRSKRSIETQLLAMVHELSDSLDRKEQVDIGLD